MIHLKWESRKYCFHLSHKEDESNITEVTANTPKTNLLRLRLNIVSGMQILTQSVT